jgi:dienelactone hydrolase
MTLAARGLRLCVLIVAVECVVVGAACSAEASAIASSTTSLSSQTAGTRRVATVDPALGVSVAPVRPTYSAQQSSFEGHEVYSSIPAHPVGVVYMFHGTGGGAGFVNKLETVDLLNTFVSQGYGFVSTDSTNRTTKQWNVTDPSVATNPDLARLAKLRHFIIATTTVTASTPTYGIGMSNGSAFAALWAATSERTGMKVSAVGLYMSAPRPVVFQTGGLEVPTFMVIAQNDTVTNPSRERAVLRRIAANGTPTELKEVVQQPIMAARYLRIPGVTQAMANAIVDAYQQAGVIDAKGNLIVPLPNVRAGEQAKPFGVTLPSSLSRSQNQAASNETLATIGEHQFNAEFKVQNMEFFSTHRSS